MRLARTDAEGRFRIGGLRADRAYRLRLADERTAQWRVTEPLQPGDGVELFFPSDAVRSRFAGKVVDDLGHPLVDASVAVWGPGYDTRDWRPSLYGDRTRTDATGRFVLEDVPLAGVHLFIDHPEIHRQVVPIDEWVDGAAKTLARAARLRIEFVDGADVSEVSFEDARGRRVSAWRLVGLGRRLVDSVSVVDSQTPVLELPCDVSTVVLWGDGRVVRRAPLQLSPGTLNRITL